MESGRTVVDGRFEVLEALGSGGMGTVWRAYDLVLHREVALKEVLAAEGGTGGAGAAQRERVLREARALARIRHPNVVAVHHIVDSPASAHPWIVMELVRGRSLADRLEYGPMNAVEVAQLGRGMLAALRAAHAVGVLHRDIKPANVLLREDGSPVLTDFGIAAVEGLHGLTSTGSVVGSLDYVAPERLDSREGHPASDLWSLGLLLYVAVEGYHPLRRETTAATLAAVVRGDVPPPRQAGPLTPVLRALLVTDPDRRPSLERADAMLAQAAGAAAPLPSTPAESAPWPSPGGSAPWPAPAASAPISSAAEPRQVVRPRVGKRWVPVGVAAVVVVAGLVAAVALWPDRSGSQANPGLSPETSQAPGGRQPAGAVVTTAAKSGNAVDLLTPDGIRQVVAAFENASGVQEFSEVTFYPEYANAGMPISAGSKRYDSYTYRDGGVSKQGPGGTLSGSETTVVLSSIDWGVLPGLLEAADQQLNVPDATMRYVIVDPAWTFNDDRPTIMVYLIDAYSGAAYLAADLDGTVVKVYPRES
ncbi:serine/threonine-protein kinase [Nocardia sp. NPDC127526]|uniref:serine/threonine-protein kinase n=1 Tax=Nocardia sp. NPDC127526 TaxID=3345393 RepID=UPI0036324D9C